MIDASANEGESRPQVGSLGDYLKLLRPRQWIKNLVCYVGVIFSVTASNPILLLKATLCVVAFCAASSAIYIFNDVLDRDSDRLHPTKKFRPIAAGRVGIKTALFVSLLLALFALGLGFFLRPTLAICVLAYLVLMVFYSTTIKHQPLLDVFAIAAGFVLRAVGGAATVAAPISSWFLMFTSFGALFIGLEKRRQELKLLKQDGVQHRKVLAAYSEEFLTRAEGLIITSLITTYVLYSFESFHGRGMLITVPFVVYGIMRYQLLSVQDTITGSPEEIFLKDRPIRIAVALWLLSCVIVMYGTAPALWESVGRTVDSYRWTGF